MRSGCRADCGTSAGSIAKAAAKIHAPMLTAHCLISTLFICAPAIAVAPRVATGKYPYREDLASRCEALGRQTPNFLRTSTQVVFEQDKTRTTPATSDEFWRDESDFPICDRVPRWEARKC